MHAALGAVPCRGEGTARHAKHWGQESSLLGEHTASTPTPHPPAAAFAPFPRLSGLTCTSGCQTARARLAR